MHNAMIFSKVTLKGVQHFSYEKFWFHQQLYFYADICGDSIVYDLNWTPIAKCYSDTLFGLTEGKNVAVLFERFDGVKVWFHLYDEKKALLEAVS